MQSPHQLELLAWKQSKVTEKVLEKAAGDRVMNIYPKESLIQVEPEAVIPLISLPGDPQVNFQL